MKAFSEILGQSHISSLSYLTELLQNKNGAEENEVLGLNWGERRSIKEVK